MDHIEPDLKYCLRCEDEYRADIERCGVCGDPLVTGREVQTRQAAQRERIAGRMREIGPDDELVVLRTGPLRDMKHLENLLRAERIPVVIAGDDKSCGKGCCPSTFFLQVRSDDSRDAYTVLEREFRTSTGLDSHDAGGGGDALFDERAGVACCPACGTSFATTTTTCPDCGLCFG